MGNTVEKLAFQPPDPDYAKALLCPNAKGSRVKFLTTRSGTSISVLHFENPTAKDPSTPVPPIRAMTILYAHGNAEDLGYSFSFFQKLHTSLTCNVLAFDYSGYGCSSGTPSEAQTYADIDACYEYLTRDRGVSPRNIVVVGRSLGSGPATDLASRTPSLGGLILVSPLASACAVAGMRIRYLLKPLDIFENNKKIGKVRNKFPVYILHGRKDEVVPFAHGEELYYLLTRPVKGEDHHDGQGRRCEVRHWWIDRCGHNDIEAIEGERFFSNLRQFVQQIALSLPSGSP